MSEGGPTRQVSMPEADAQGIRQERDVERGGDHRLVLPEDGYGWKKYGQKFIKNIGMYRSYFKCQNGRCRAKKRADWSEWKPNKVRVVYNGVHTHTHAASPPPPPDSGFSGGTSASASNQYNLLTQVFGTPTPTNTNHEP